MTPEAVLFALDAIEHRASSCAHYSPPRHCSSVCLPPASPPQEKLKELSERAAMEVDAERAKLEALTREKLEAEVGGAWPHGPVVAVLPGALQCVHAEHRQAASLHAQSASRACNVIELLPQT